jgi:hypothetical protein
MVYDRSMVETASLHDTWHTHARLSRTPPLQAEGERVARRALLIAELLPRRDPRDDVSAVTHWRQNKSRKSSFSEACRTPKSGFQLKSSRGFYSQPLNACQDAGQEGAAAAGGSLAVAVRARSPCCKRCRRCDAAADAGADAGAAAAAAAAACLRRRSAKRCSSRLSAPSCCRCRRCCRRRSLVIRPSHPRRP